MKVLLIGGYGQLGTEIRKRILAQHPDWTLATPHRAVHDIAGEDTAANLINKDFPWDAVINCAAFHKVEACEADPVTAFAVNAHAVHRLATQCARTGAHLVHVSTDYVFGDHRRIRRALTEDDSPAPLNTYGGSKLTGEALIIPTGCSATVARVASLFGHAGASGKGGNFIETMIRKARAGEPISVVSDVWMSPTHAADAASAIVTLTERVETGTFHVVNRGHASWLMLARHALKEAGLGDYPVQGHLSSDRPSTVQRPSWSPLCPDKLEDEVGVLMRSWQEAVIDYVRHRSA